MVKSIKTQMRNLIRIKGIYTLKKLIFWRVVIQGWDIVTKKIKNLFFLLCQNIVLKLYLNVLILCSGGCSIFLYIGIRYSSPTLASATNNLSPAFTFIMGIIFRYIYQPYQTNEKILCRLVLDYFRVEPTYTK